MGSILNNILLWMILAFVFMTLTLILFIFLILLAKRTHAIIEFRAMFKGNPIALFFQENRYCHWEPVKPEAGIITHKDYGAFIVNEKATYIDKKTKNILIPFDAAFGASVNIHAAKLADDLGYIMKDEEEQKKLRGAIANDEIEENATIKALKTSIHIGALKSQMTALIPHNINAKIEKIVASRMRGMGNVNAVQVLLLFAGILGAIVAGFILLKIFNQ